MDLNIQLKIRVIVNLRLRFILEVLKGIPNVYFCTFYFSSNSGVELVFGFL